MERLIPEENRLAVRMIPHPDEVRGIKIPDEAKERPQRAVIVGIGPDCAMIPVQKHPRAVFNEEVGAWLLDGATHLKDTLVPKWRVGDCIYVGRFSGTDVTPSFMDPETWMRVLRETEVLMRVLD